MSEMNRLEAVVSTARVLPFTPKEVFAAFQQPERLARWWGPQGFSNTFKQFEFKAGGRWVFVMHGPNGVNYPNENVFQELSPDEKIVIRHASSPLFTLTVTLTVHDGGTHLTWHQEFDSAEVAAQLRPMCEPANEENLDRMHAVLAGEAA